MTYNVFGGTLNIAQLNSTVLAYAVYAQQSHFISFCIILSQLIKTFAIHYLFAAFFLSKSTLSFMKFELLCCFCS